MDMAAMVAALKPKGTKRGGALFDALSDIEKSAVTQTTGGSRRQMDGAPDEMLKLQRRMQPDQYREMMENQLLTNETPLAQLLEALGIRQGEPEARRTFDPAGSVTLPKTLDFNKRFSMPK
jgi:hypothetical protein